MRRWEEGAIAHFPRETENNASTKQQTRTRRREAEAILRVRTAARGGSGTTSQPLNSLGEDEEDQSNAKGEEEEKTTPQRPDRGHRAASPQGDRGGGHSRQCGVEPPPTLAGPSLPPPRHSTAAAAGMVSCPTRQSSAMPHCAGTEHLLPIQSTSTSPPPLSGTPPRTSPPPPPQNGRRPASAVGRDTGDDEEPAAPPVDAAAAAAAATVAASTSACMSARPRQARLASRTSRMDHFWACVRTCVWLRVATCAAIALRSLVPYRERASTKRRCSEGVQ